MEALIVERISLKKILPSLCLLLVTGTIISCIAWEPSQPPLIRIENVHDSGSKKVAFSPTGWTFFCHHRTAYRFQNLSG